MSCYSQYKTDAESEVSTKQVFEKKCEVKFAAEPKQTCANVPEQKCRTVAHTIFDTGENVFPKLSQCPK